MESYPISVNTGAIAQIKRYDRALFIKMNYRLNRWELWRKTDKRRNGEAFVLRVENPDGSFRPVDMRLLKYLVNNDTWKHKNALQQARDMNYYEQRQREKEDRNYTERLIDIGLDPYVRRAFQEKFG